MVSSFFVSFRFVAIWTPGCIDHPFGYCGACWCVVGIWRIRCGSVYPVRKYPLACQRVIPNFTNTGVNTPCEFSNGISFVKDF